MGNMLDLHPNEKIVMVLRRHWWVMVGPTASLVILATIPLALGIVAPQLMAEFDYPQFDYLVGLVLALYLMGLLLFAFILWTNYYLDAWVITNERIIDIEQLNLFSRSVSEFPLEKVQDVSVEVHGLLQTFLRFGDLVVSTAGHYHSFTIKSVPSLHEAKDAILAHLIEERRAQR